MGFQTLALPRPVLQRGRPPTPIVDRNLVRKRWVEPAAVEAKREWVAPVCVEVTTVRLPSPGTVTGDAHRGAEILVTVSRLCGVGITKLKSEQRGKAIIKARQIAAWLMCTRCVLSMPQVGHLLGGRDHTTVLHARRRVDGVLAALGLPGDLVLNEQIIALYDADWPALKTIAGPK